MSPFNYKTTESELSEEEFMLEGEHSDQLYWKWEAPVWMTNTFRFYTSFKTVKAALLV